MEFNFSDKQFEKRFSENNNSEKFKYFQEEFVGPNVNIKFPKKKIKTEEDKKYLREKIKTKQKTELCKNWVLYNDCFFKETCSFAHGEEELRSKNIPFNYKTQICKSFFEKSYCVYGNRCHYSHKIRYILNLIKIKNYRKSKNEPKKYENILNQIAKEFEYLEKSENWIYPNSLDVLFNEKLLKFLNKNSLER